MTLKATKQACDRRAAKVTRARRRRGAVRVTFELSQTRLAFLASAGYLDSAAKVTPNTATLAIEALLADHLPT